MTFYERMQTVAAEKIAEFGTDIVFERETVGVTDPVTGAYTPGITEQQTLKAVILPASQGVIEALDARFDADGLVESNLRQLKVAAKGADWSPRPGEVARFGGHGWSIIGNTPINPDGMDLIYTVSVRR